MGICPRCGLPEELCICDKITTTERISVSFDNRKYNKVVTIIEGIDKENMENTAKEIKKQLGCGGTIRGNVIELQGDHKSRIKDVLIKMGFPEEKIEIKDRPLRKKKR